MGGESAGFDLAGEIRRITRNMLKRKESEMGITEDLRELARRLGGKRGFSCSKYLADEFGIECGEVSCGECYACLFERIADRIETEPDELRDENERLRGMVREPQLPEGVEWPRFEDGEPVALGCDIEHHSEVWRITNIGFNAVCWSLSLHRGYDFAVASGSYGERLKRPTPKVLDADGAPINVGDTVWCGEDQLSVVCFTVGAAGDVRTTVKDDEGMHYTLKPSCLSRKRPDSWERLEEDAKKYVCEYAGAKRSIVHDDRYSCLDCAYDSCSSTNATCNKQMRLDLVRRAKALAKAGER